MDSTGNVGESDSVLVDWSELDDLVQLDPSLSIINSRGLSLHISKASCHQITSFI